MCLGRFCGLHCFWLGWKHYSLCYNCQRWYCLLIMFYNYWQSPLLYLPPTAIINILLFHIMWVPNLRCRTHWPWCWRASPSTYVLPCGWFSPCHSDSRCIRNREANSNPWGTTSIIIYFCPYFLWNQCVCWVAFCCRRDFVPWWRLPWSAR